MRIGKGPIEILDWEAGNEGYEIIISQSYNQDELQYLAFIEIDKEHTAFFHNKSCEHGMVRVFGKTKDEVLKYLCIAISGRIIGYYSDIATYSSFKSNFKFLPILVHTKLVEPEEGIKLNPPSHNLKSEKVNWVELPIDAEGWEEIEDDEYESKIYIQDGYNSRVNFCFLHYTLRIDTGIIPILIDEINFKSFVKKANLIETDSLKNKCFKIANYICSRLFHKIENI